MMSKEEDELLLLFKKRRIDRARSKTRRVKALESRVTPLGSLINAFFSQDKQVIKKIEEQKALLAWPDYVGQSAARISRALRVRNQTLVVYVRDSLWMQQLSLLKNDLVDRYRRDFPTLGVKTIFFTNQA